jgi:hypothetical protein
MKVFANFTCGCEASVFPGPAIPAANRTGPANPVANRKGSATSTENGPSLSNPGKI